MSPGTAAQVGLASALTQNLAVAYTGGMELHPLLEQFLEDESMVERPGDGTRRALRHWRAPEDGDPVLWVTPARYAVVTADGQVLADGTDLCPALEALRRQAEPLYAARHPDDNRDGLQDLYGPRPEREEPGRVTP